jgi:uncharacterized alpha-E superfamily protein
MSRYMERSDGILRMLRMNYASSQDDFEFSWKPVLRIFTYLDEDEAETIAYQTREVLQYMVTEKENPNSVLNVVTLARENARSVQDHISKELWQCVNDFYHIIRDQSLVRRLNREDPITVLDEIVKQCVLFYGTADITMARGEGNAFMNIGKYLERGIQSADILNVKFSTMGDDIDKTANITYWKYLLLSIAGYQLYLKTYRSGFEARNVVEQIVLNDQFPRSISYSISRLHIYFRKLKSESNSSGFNEIEFMIGKLESKVQYSTAEAIIQQNLHLFLNDITAQLNRIGTSLDQKMFSYL